jgi:hypothetical protein
MYRGFLGLFMNRTAIVAECSVSERFTARAAVALDIMNYGVA